jgi:hypothetical protein
MKTIITLDKANQPYGFPQLYGNRGLSANTITASTYMGGYAHFGTGNPSPYLGSLHNVEITASGSTAPLTLIGGTGGVEVWIDDTPTKAIWFGAASPGAASNGNLYFSTYSSGESWQDRIVVNSATGDLGIGTSSPTNRLHVYASSNPFRLEGLTADTSDTNLLSVDGTGVVHTYPLSGLTGSSTSGLFLPLSGGTVTGGTIFQSGLTANTLSATSINKVDYIIFNTGTTSAATVPGTVYFDNTQKALSYNTSINQGVTVNLGQQNYIRVYNVSGTQIERGKALEIFSGSSGLPAVVLAVNRQNSNSIIGVSAEVIPNNSEGIAITYGIIDNIKLTGSTLGGIIYASDTIPGDLDSAAKYLDFPLTARTNVVGYVVQTGVTDGKLFVNINNENNILSLTDLQRNVLEGNVISTGVFEFSGLTITSPSATTFNVAPVKAWLVDNTTDPVNPTVSYVNYTGGTAIPATNVTTATETYILLTSGGTITQQTTFPTPQQRRENVYLGKFGHGNKTYLINAFSEPDYDMSPISQLRDMFVPIRLINAGVIPSDNGANLTFNTSSGTLYGLGINFINNVLNPNTLSVSGQSPTTFQYRTQTGGTATNRTTIDPGNYDLNGVVTPVSGTKATNQRIYLLQNGQIRVQYGQYEYANVAAAVAAVQKESFVTFPNFVDNGILIGVLSVISNTTVLNDTSKAQFFVVSKFGEVVGAAGGTSTTTLQQAYNNSSSPAEIITNSTLGALHIQNGQGADNVSTIFEAFNSGGTSTAFIRADGLISGSSVAAVSISATTYYGIPSSSFSGGTVTGPTNFTNGLTGNTILAGSGSINSSAALEVSSTTQGFLPPRMTEAQRIAISTPATGLMVYQTDGDEGLYINKSFGWVQII